LTVYGRGLENNHRPAVILKPRQAYAAYRAMLRWYAVRGLMAFLDERPDRSFGSVVAEPAAPPVRDWVNLGGQIVPAFRVDALRADIGAGKTADWDAIHAEYDGFAREYPLDLLRHCRAVLEELRAEEGASALDAAAFISEIRTAVSIKDCIAEQVRLSRAKDFSDPFRASTFRNPAEAEAVLGSPESNSFIKRAYEEAAAFREEAERLIVRLAGA
jgi:hypothetical protein